MVLMDHEVVRRLLTGGETYTVEFKRATSKQSLNDRELVEAVVCLANGSGGVLLLGVEDDGEVTGVGPRHGDGTNIDLIRALIINHSDPSVSTTVSAIELDGHVVVAIEVPDMPTPVGTTSGVYRRRSTKSDGTPECVPYRPHEMMSAGFSLTGRDYAEVPARGVTMDDLDPAEFDRLRRLSRTGRGDAILAEASDVEICRALRVIRGGGAADELTIGAVLLFGRPDALSRHAPTAEYLFQVIATGKIATNQTFRVPLLKAAEELFNLVDRYNSEDEVIVGLHRVGVPRIPRVTRREAIANALVHRDYAELGPVTVRLTDEEFIVQNPGGLPPGVTLTNLLEESKPRSVVLADAFKRAGIVDRAGRGIPDMFTSLLRVGRDAPDYSRTTDRSVTVATQTSNSDLDMVRFIATYEDDHNTPLALDQLRILHELKDLGASTLREIQESLSVPIPALRVQLTKLIELGLLEVRGNGRSRRYHLTAGFYRAAQDPNAYIRIRAVDPIQQDQMVLQFVQTYGTITRGQVAELCMLTPVQARTVLQRLVSEDWLEMRGERRGAHYVLASP
jgi:ATP-dependent DNA helicase RecG